MKLELDVWLERHDPRIIVRDADSRRVLLQWDSDTVQRELASGDLCLEDLCDTALSCAERLGLVAQAQPGRRRYLRLADEAHAGGAEQRGGRQTRAREWAQADSRMRFLPSRLAW